MASLTSLTINAAQTFLIAIHIKTGQQFVCEFKVHEETRRNMGCIQFVAAMILCITMFSGGLLVIEKAYFVGGAPVAGLAVIAFIVVMNLVFGSRRSPKEGEEDCTMSGRL